MPRYISMHTLACLTRQGAEELVRRLHTAPFAARRVLLNLTEGKMWVEFEGADRATLEGWMAREGFHYDWLMRVEFESSSGTLKAV